MLGNGFRSSRRWMVWKAQAGAGVTDIAPLALFLASGESAWITGEVIRAAGGLVVAT